MHDIYIIDRIIKNVQGDYIKHFEANINWAFNLIFQKTQSPGEKKTLLKMIKLWDMFFSKEKIQGIYENL